MKIELKYTEGKILVANKLKSGEYKSGSSRNVTEECISAVLQYLVEMKTEGDGIESFSTEKPIKKYGQMEYDVHIILTPSINR